MNIHRRLHLQRHVGPFLIVPPEILGNLSAIRTQGGGNAREERVGMTRTFEERPFARATHFETALGVYPKCRAASRTPYPPRTIRTASMRRRGNRRFVSYIPIFYAPGVSKPLNHYI